MTRYECGNATPENSPHFRDPSRSSAQSDQEILLVLVLERSDATALVEVSLREMEKSGGGSRAHVAAWWSPGARQMGAKVCLIAMPATEPAIGGGDREGKPTLMPDLVE